MAKAKIDIDPSLLATMRKRVANKLEAEGVVKITRPSRRAMFRADSPIPDKVHDYETPTAFYVAWKIAPDLTEADKDDYIRVIEKHTGHERMTAAYIFERQWHSFHDWNKGYTFASAMNASNLARLWSQIHSNDRKGGWCKDWGPLHGKRPNMEPLRPVTQAGEFPEEICYIVWTRETEPNDADWEMLGKAVNHKGEEWFNCNDLSIKLFIGPHKRNSIHTNTKAHAAAMAKHINAVVGWRGWLAGSVKMDWPPEPAKPVQSFKGVVLDGRRQRIFFETNGKDGSEFAKRYAGKNNPHEGESTGRSCWGYGTIVAYNNTDYKTSHLIADLVASGATVTEVKDD